MTDPEANSQDSTVRRQRVSPSEPALRQPTQPSSDSMSWNQAVPASDQPASDQPAPQDVGSPDSDVRIDPNAPSTVTVHAPGDEAITGTASPGDPVGLDEAPTVIRRVSSGNSSSPKADPRLAHGGSPVQVTKGLVGRQLNQYHLQALIGGGGMGAVFRAHDEQLDRIVALKVIPFVGNDPELQRRFRNEAQNAAKLDHPRIARVFDAGNYDSWHYIVFEHIEGINLRDLVLTQGVLSLDDAVVYTSQVAEALAHASQRGIVHRDIKPSNILVTSDGAAKLVDMGLARSANLEFSEDKTASGITLGTFDYISPEQAMDPREADLRSDLYSLGCTFYFLLTGEAPYNGGTMLQKLISHGNAPPPDPQELRPDLPDEAVEIMHRMMAKEPKFRYQNAGDLLSDLNELAYRFQLRRAQAITVAAPSQAIEGLQRLQTHLPWMIAVLLILIVGGFLRLQSIIHEERFGIEVPDALADRIRSAGNPADSAPGVATAAVQPGGGTSRQPNAAVGDGRPVPVNGDPTNGTENGTGGSPQGRDASAGDQATGRMDSGTNQDSSSRSADAAKPPRLNLEPPNSERLLAGDVLSLPGIDLQTESTSAFPPTPLQTGNAGMAGQAGPDPHANGVSLPDTGPGADSEGGLPAPQVVRVVSSPRFAAALKVNDIDRDQDGAVVASALDTALQLAEQLGLNKIELAVEEVVTGPVEIPRDNLEIVSTVGRTVIQLDAVQGVDEERSQMVDVGSHPTKFVNLDFRWELGAEQVEGGAMFVFNENRLTQFENCTLTLINQPIHDNVRFIEVETATATRESLADPAQDGQGLPLVALQINNGIVRGEGSFISMDQAAALQLVWNNGLLAISGRMIDSGGAVTAIPGGDQRIQLSLSDVTAEIPLGFFRLRTQPGQMYPVLVERQCLRCVFVVDDGQPLFQFIGIDELGEEEMYLNLRGEDNTYLGASDISSPLLVVSDMPGNQVLVTLGAFDEPENTWIQERQVRWTVRWSDSQRPNRQIYYDLTPANYRQDGAIFYGFREQDLPVVTTESN
ncbi:MAG: hypothetical protein CBB71_12415 [Rhodopirellula sp. TMED11]|nr:MAG: hypothetical protein CBB71_12415 [Rhodopirellula sp. TMED11]